MSAAADDYVDAVAVRTDEYEYMHRAYEYNICQYWPTKTL